MCTRPTRVACTTAPACCWTWRSTSTPTSTCRCGNRTAAATITWAASPSTAPGVNLGEWREDVRHRGAHYVVTFEVTDTHARPLDHAIELRSLRCVNAQEASDEVFLKINGETVTTTMDMDDDEPARALDVHRSFHRNVFVELWEDDAGGHGSDCLGRMTLLLAEVQRQLAEGSEPVRFSWRSGAVNAVYELDYRLTR